MKTKSIIKSVLAVCLVFLSCKQNKKEPQKKSKKTAQTEKVDTFQPITLTGVSDDSKALDHTGFVNYSYFPGIFHQEPIQRKKKDSLQITFNAIKQPQIVELFAFGKKDIMYNTRFLVTPGDHISFSIKNKVISFQGKNAAHYNFFNQLDSTNEEYAKNAYKGDLLAYKKRTEKIYNRRQKFFNNYIEQHKVSAAFKKLVGAELKFEYLLNLIAPRANPVSIRKGISTNSQKDLLTIAANDYNNEENGFFDLGAYLDHPKISDFKRPELINNDYFQRALVKFIREYFVNADALSYTKKRFLKEKKYIEEHLSGNLENYAAIKLVKDYFDNGFGQDKTSRALLRHTIAAYSTKKLKPSYRQALQQVKARLAVVDKSFPKTVLASKLVDRKGDTITLKEVLKQTKNHIKVIDFWASWCHPCVDEIKGTKAFKNKLRIENGVEWIYLSVDKNAKDWLKKSKELHSSLKSKQQYRIVEGYQSVLAKYLKVKAIPRYVVFDKMNKIVVNNSPRPSKKDDFQKIINNINSKNE